MTIHSEPTPQPCDFSHLLDANKYLLRLSPFYEGTVAAGCRGYDHINGMTVAVDYGHSPHDEAAALSHNVALYDTAIQRQIEVTGPDAVALCDRLFTRDLIALRPGRASYGFFCRGDGVIITDAVVSLLEPGRVWLSPTITDVMLWVQGFACAAGYDAGVAEAEYATARLEGRRTFDLIRELAGPTVDQLSYYACAPAEIAGVGVLISKTASGPGPGCDIYIPTDQAMRVWSAVERSGAKHGLLIKGWDDLDNSTMIESGALFFSYTTNYVDRITPLALPRPYVDLDAADFVGKEALLAIRSNGGSRQKLVGLRATENLQPATPGRWVVLDEEEAVGYTRWVVWSPTLKATIAYAIVETEQAARIGSPLTVLFDSGPSTMSLARIPFVAPNRAG